MTAAMVSLSTQRVDRGAGLRRALYNFMHGNGLDEDVRSWFDETPPAPGRARKTRRTTVPAPAVPRDLIRRALEASPI